MSVPGNHNPECVDISRNQSQSTVPVEIIAEMIKAIDEIGIEKNLSQMCNKIWNTYKWPREQKKSIYIPLYKKDAKQQCFNYKTVSLINHGRKIMLSII